MGAHFTESIIYTSSCFTVGLIFIYLPPLARILNYGTTLSSLAEFAMNLDGWFCIEYFRL